MFLLLIKRELLICMRRKMQWAMPLIFFVIIVSLFPLSLPPEAAIFKLLGGGILWVAAFLATLLSLETMLRDELTSGSIVQTVLSVVPLPLVVLAKAIAHWLTIGLPLLIITPLIGVMLQLPGTAILGQLLVLLLALPTLSLLGTIGVSLTLGLKQGGILLAVIMLPLYIPVLIIAANASVQFSEGLPIIGHIAILLAMLVASLLLAPVAAAAALRVAVC